MSTIRERISEEFRKEKIKARKLGLAEGRAEGIIQGIAQTIEKMIKMNFEDEIIKEATGVKETEIQRIRKQMMKI